MTRQVKLVWNITPIYHALEIACKIAKQKEPDQTKENLIELGMELWNLVDPTPALELDDKIVKALISWIVDRIWEETQNSFTKDSNLS